MDLDVNRRPVKVECDPATPLLWVLRDHLSLTGTKFGCGVAACGACTVHVDGAAVRSCVLPVFGMFSEIISTFSRKKLFGYTSMVYA
ncbi:2Fe-2S iron-sulfur cluster-binding protein, partial [Ralstonia pseudosolanacearum]|uniref:(2Fe-2S)-binding protein n=1 Tax=Ralstonia pseudosolanacearum TaxID=1310165 RepID=UPI003D170052